MPATEPRFPSIEAVFDRCMELTQSTQGCDGAGYTGPLTQSTENSVFRAADGRPLEPDALIGMFQALRPEGAGLETIFEDFARGDELTGRLSRVFTTCGDGRRDAIMRDAFFIVKNPAEIDHRDVQRLAEQWVENMDWLAQSVPGVAAFPDPRPSVRVLEGKPPKQPRHDIDKTDTLRYFQDVVPKLLETAAPDLQMAAFLQPAFYFVACDPMLRDYLMWPLYRDAIRIGNRPIDSFDPFAPYYELWKHGVKFRIYRDEQIDFYMPRLDQEQKGCDPNSQ